MNLFSALPIVTRRFRTPRQIIGHSWADRYSVLEPDVNLFCWKRPVLPEVSNYLERSVRSDLKPISFFTHTSDLLEKLHKFKVNWSGHHNDSGEAFWGDVYQLTHDFLTSFSKEKSGTVYLKVINSNECTKYHVDGYSLRLFTTYYGPGTEWLPEKAVNRSGLGKTNRQILKDPSHVQQMDTFEVGILKGELPNRINHTKGIVHRSPEIEHMKEKRIVLRVDI